MSELRGILLVIIGVVTLGYYYSWWFLDGRLSSPLLLLGLAIGLSYGFLQILGSWLLYLATHRRTNEVKPLNEALTTDVFITACGEDYSMIERSLTAACNLKGNHKTWLLDDKSDPVLLKLAKEYGAGYLTRPGHKDAKAGNVNEALKKTSGDIVVLFDVDHVPNPDFLERTLNYFCKPNVGFVQVMPTFSNGDESWVAQAAAETSLDFYNPTSIGMDGLKSVTKMGTNSLIRRDALEQIGGYRPGLAEDLATSLELHAAGWGSVYVAEPLAPGLVPPDLSAWFTQQLKWARGVFDLLLTAYPRLFPKLSWGQRISYAVRTTKYWIGFIIFIHLLLTIAVLFFGDNATREGFENYLMHFFPLAFIEALIRFLALRKWGSNIQVEKGQGNAIALVYATWPIYSLAWLMAIFRYPLRFKPTPKHSSGLKLGWLLPQLITTCLLLSALFFTILAASGHLYPLSLLFAVLQVVAHIIFFRLALGSLKKVKKPNYSPKRSKAELWQYSSDVNK